MPGAVQTAACALPTEMDSPAVLPETGLQLDGGGSNADLESNPAQQMDALDGEAGTLSCDSDVRIMLLGDSLTAGMHWVPNSDSNMISTKWIAYRKALWDELQAFNDWIDLVGGVQNGGYYASSGFDVDHQGLGAWRTDNILQYIYDYDLIPPYPSVPLSPEGWDGETNFLGNHEPDVILLLIGANDIYNSVITSTIVSNVNSILNEVDDYETAEGRTIPVIVAGIPQWGCYSDSSCPTIIASISSYNAALEALVDYRVGSGDNLNWVDMEVDAGLDYQTYPVGDFNQENGSDTRRIHPSDYGAGADKMAAVWLAALNTVLPACARADSSPTAVEDSANNSVDVLGNDSGPGLSLLSVSAGSAGGTLSLAGDHLSVLYTPAANFFGTETFSYELTSTRPLIGNSGVVTVTVTDTEDPPVAVKDGFIKAEDSSAGPLDLLANDEAANVDAGEALTITLVGSASKGGTVVLAGDKQSVTYTPAVNFFGVETFPYTMTDGSGLSSSETAVVTVTAVNDPPTADPDSYTLPEDSSTYTLTVLSNDSFAPDSGESLSISEVGALSAGGIITNSLTQLVYQPALNFNGSETFTYIVNDGTPGSLDTATVVVTVTAVNDPPLAVSDLFTKVEDSSANPLDLLANDEDANPDAGETLTITDVGSASQGGSLSLLSNKKSVIYSPAADFFGVETFSYTMTDGTGATDSAVVAVTVTALNDPPAARPDSYTRWEDSSPYTMNVLANDTSAPDSGETLTIIDVGEGSAGGSLVLAGDHKSILYTPAANFYGTETFTYTINDGTPGSNATTVETVIVRPVADNPAVVNPGAQSSAEGQAVSLQIQASDPDVLPPASDTTQYMYSATGLPEGLSIGSTGLINGTISYDAASSVPYTVEIMITKTVTPTLYSSIVFAWSVSNTNRAPQVVNPGAQLNQQHDTVSLQVQASHADGGPLTFSAEGLPAGLWMSSSGLISGTINAWADSVYTVKVRVSDGEAECQAVFLWYIGEIKTYLSLLQNR